MAAEYTNVTHTFADFYVPRKALLMYEHVQDNRKMYCESYDCNDRGRLVNAHPLSKREIESLAQIFEHHSRESEKFLLCDELLPENLLYLSPKHKCVIWYTPRQHAQLYFARTLPLADGHMPLPALLWKATDSDLFVFAIKEQTKPNATTALYHAPFFNIYADGRVCMGTVEATFEDCCNVIQFIAAWQQYFFNSHFSHTLGSYATTGKSLETLYSALLNSSLPFPENELMSTGRTLQNILP